MGEGYREYRCGASATSRRDLWHGGCSGTCGSALQQKAIRREEEERLREGTSRRVEGWGFEVRRYLAGGFTELLSPELRGYLHSHPSS